MAISYANNKKVESKRVEKISENAIEVMAREFVYYSQEMARLRDLKKSVGKKLMDIMTDQEIKAIPVGDFDAIVSKKEKSSKKCTRTAIIEAYGEDGRKFWDELPACKQAYLSVQKTRGDEVLDEDED
jgi:hypothetical protein